MKAPKSTVRLSLSPVSYAEQAQTIFMADAPRPRPTFANFAILIRVGRPIAGPSSRKGPGSENISLALPIPSAFVTRFLTSSVAALGPVSNWAEQQFGGFSIPGIAGQYGL
jgi:hypothetical protein